MSFALRRALDRLQPEKPHATEFRATLASLGITQHRVAQLFGVGPRSVRRWQAGDRRVPFGVAIVLRLLAAGVVTITQVEQVAVSTPAQTNGGGAPLRIEPTSEQPALAPAEGAAFADPGPTTAEKVCKLTPEACRWPCGDPGHPNFHFCSRPIAKESYCEHHLGVAYMAPPKSRSPFTLQPASKKIVTRLAHSLTTACDGVYRRIDAACSRASE